VKLRCSAIVRNAASTFKDPRADLTDYSGARHGSTLGEIMNADDDTIADLVTHPAFAGFGHLLLPWDDRTGDHSMRLRNIGSLLPYHSDVDPATVVSALNRMIDDVNNGKTVFHEFYTEEEKKQQPARSLAMARKKSV
jgi:hypothetical protein